MKTCADACVFEPNKKKAKLVHVIIIHIYKLNMKEIVTQKTEKFTGDHRSLYENRPSPKHNCLS